MAITREATGLWPSTSYPQAVGAFAVEVLDSPVIDQMLFWELAVSPEHQDVSIPQHLREFLREVRAT